MSEQRTDTQTLIAAMEILSRDIKSDDGVANAAIAEAAQRLHEFEYVLTAERAKVKELEAQNAVMREALYSVCNLINESTGVYGLHLNGDPSPWEELRTGGRFEDWLYKFDKALSLTPSEAAEMARKKDEPDWFFCDIDPDESGTSAYEAMYQHRPRLEPTLVRSSFIGPDFWCVMCPKETDDEDGEEVCMSFATENEAMAFCQKIKVEIEAARASGVEV